MRLFQRIYSVPELCGLSHEERNRIIKTSKALTWKDKKVWLSLGLLFLASWMSNISVKMIIFSSWFWNIESELVRKAIIQIAPWPLIILALIFFGLVYERAFRAAIRDNLKKIN